MRAAGILSPRRPVADSVRVQELQTEIGRRLAQFSAEVEAASALGHTDISSAFDVFLVELLSVTFQLPDLRSLNAERANFPGVDLADDTAHHAFQVTADRSLDKILKTLSTSIRHGLHETYPKIQVFVTSRRQQSYKQATIDGIVQGALDFNAARDVLDYRDLLKLYSTFDVDRLQKIANILRKHDSNRSAPLSADWQEVLERDVANRFEQALQRSPFPECTILSPFRPLAEQVGSDDGNPLSPGLRREILLRASRFEALRHRAENADRFYQQAIRFPGPTPEHPALGLLMEARGEVDEALKLLRDLSDPESRSTLIGILARQRGDEVALECMAEQRFGAEQPTTSGWIVSSQVYIRLRRVDDARALLDKVTSQQLDAAPYLVYLRGVVRLVCVFPPADQLSALVSFLPTVSFTAPVLEANELAERLDSAIADLQRCLVLIQRLNLPESRLSAEWYILWASLMHPQRKAAARNQLKADMEDPGKAVRYVQLALQYLDGYDPAHLEAHLRRRAATGGWDDADLAAALIIHIHADDHAGLAALFVEDRVRLESLLTKSRAVFYEVQALTQSGQAITARALLESNRSELQPQELAVLEAEIRAAQGADPVAEFQRVYEAHPATPTLQILVNALKQARRHQMLGPYLERLYIETQDPQDIVDAASSYAAIKDDTNFLRLVDLHAFVLDRSIPIKHYYSQLLFQRGRLREANSVAETLRSDPQHRDLSLEIALAIESGRWERLSSLLSTILETAASLDALMLIQAAQLALTSGYGPFRELLRAAVAKPDAAAEVLLGAYSLAIGAGLEDRDTTAHEWFSRALALSGPDGPVQKFELQELLEKQLAWSTHSRQINESLIKGELPLVIAAPALRTTPVDALLGNFVRNLGQADARKRTSLPLFSGRRVAARIESANRIALDTTALMVLGYLGLLPRVLEAFQSVVIPGGAVSELFEGQRRIRTFQRSRIERASQILRLRSDKFKVARPLELPPKALVDLVGIDLANLLHMARQSRGVLVRPAPVHTLGSQGRDLADLSEYSDCLTDTVSLLRTLEAQVPLEKNTAETAQRYLTAQDQQWPAAATADIHRPLYLDDVALSYLQTTNLLEKVIAYFDEVYIPAGIEEEAISLIDHERQSDQILLHIEEIRRAITAADDGGRIVFGPRRSGAANDDRDPSTLNLLHDFSGADAIVIDDRALNQEALVIGPQQQQVRLATSLDLIEELRARELISQEEVWNLRYRLRASGAALVPHDAQEIRDMAQRSLSTESAEFRMWRQSIALILVHRLPRFPSEIPWLASLISAVGKAIKEIWIQEQDLQRAARLADLILGELPNPFEWIALWPPGTSADWAESMQRVMSIAIVFAMELDDPQRRAAYFKWVQQRISDPMQLTAPDRYEAVIARIRSYILTAFTSDEPT